jgi:hypothetical protein
MTHFVQKLVREVGFGRVTQAIMLTNNSTDTEWFHQGEAQAALLCFIGKRCKLMPFRTLPRRRVRDRPQSSQMQKSSRPCEN